MIFVVICFRVSYMCRLLLPRVLFFLLLLCESADRKLFFSFPPVVKCIFACVVLCLYDVIVTVVATGVSTRVLFV